MRNQGRRRQHQSGLTLLELVVTMVVLTIGLAGYARTVAMAMMSVRSSHEATLASEAARQIVETLRAQTFKDAFRLYNSSAADDPGPGPAPGNNFAVLGLEPRKGDLDGLPGEILFPTQSVAGVLQLREDLDNAKLGMPRDLNGDLLIDAADHAGNYEELPVLVRVRWRGVGGPGSVEFQTTLAAY
jgi:prepilin-type N-terminal cleavage/methylation domain-containing protein